MFSQGSAINLSNLTKKRTYPLVFGKDIASNFTPTYEARYLSLFFEYLSLYFLSAYVQSNYN